MAVVFAGEADEVFESPDGGCIEVAGIFETEDDDGEGGVVRDALDLVAE